MWRWGGYNLATSLQTTVAGSTPSKLLEQARGRRKDDSESGKFFGGPGAFKLQAGGGSASPILIEVNHTRDVSWDNAPWRKLKKN